ncbi:MAG: hypothetical protein NPIRA03_30090 [Nitrospirales bacterium]|nr:MAG: hypothetical protein NPIRA03_30090 [Nitrospirales bacterium]
MVKAVRMPARSRFGRGRFGKGATILTRGDDTENVNTATRGDRRQRIFHHCHEEMYGTIQAWPFI